MAPAAQPQVAPDQRRGHHASGLQVQSRRDLVYRSHLQEAPDRHPPRPPAKSGHRQSTGDVPVPQPPDPARARPDLPAGAGSLYRGFIRLLGSHADAIIANSEAAKSAVQQTMWRAEVPIVVVPNFVDLQQFDCDRYDRTSIRESLGLDPNQCVVGFVGRLDRAKGADLLVEAAALLRDREDAYRFLVVGDGTERDRLHAQIRKLGLDRMVILTGLRRTQRRSCEPSTWV